MVVFAPLLGLGLGKKGSGGRCGDWESLVPVLVLEVGAFTVKVTLHLKLVEQWLDD